MIHCDVLGFCCRQLILEGLFLDSVHADDSNSLEFHYSATRSHRVSGYGANKFDSFGTPCRLLDDSEMILKCTQCATDTYIHHTYYIVYPFAPIKLMCLVCLVLVL